MKPVPTTSLASLAFIADAARAHERSAVRHEAVAAMWDRRGTPDRAVFERGCAALERELAGIDADRAALEGLRSRWLEQGGDPAGHAELERRTAEIRRRVLTAKDRDALLEEERVRLRRKHEPASVDRATEMVSVWTAEQRERAADERDRIANERDDIADERERIADEREEASDQCERGLDRRGGIAYVPEWEWAQARRIEARLERSRAETLREQATMRREIAASERLTRTPRPSAPHAASAPASARAHAVTSAERASRRSRELAAQLSSLLVCTVEVLEESARLAEEHGQRHQQAGANEAAAQERRVADRARHAARCARSHAEDSLKLAATPEAAPLRDDTRFAARKR
jgi:hypothetical protein